MKRIRCLLISPLNYGEAFCGEDAYTLSLINHPPPGVDYFFYNDLISQQLAWRIKSIEKIFFWLSQYRLNILPLTWLLTIDTKEFFDIVHFHATGIHIGKFLSAKNIPMIASASSFPSEFFYTYKNWGESQVNNYTLKAKLLFMLFDIYHSQFNNHKVKRFVVWSQRARDMYISTGINPLNIDVIPPAQVFYDSSHKGSKNKRIRIIFVGNSFIRKGGLLLLEAVKKLNTEFENYLELIIVSNNVNQEISLKNTKNFSNLNHQEVMDLYKNSDIFVLPSYDEGYGVAVIEAMSYGIPCIVSNVGALPEIVGNGDYGLVINAGDAEALYNKLKLLIKDHHLRSTLSANIRKYMNNNYSPDVIGYRIREAYEKAIDI